MKDKFLQAISNVLHPMLMATYAMILICCYTPIGVLPNNILLTLVGEIFFFTCLVPFLAIFLLYKFKVVNHWALRDRKERGKPLFINFLAYVTCSLVLINQGIIPMWSIFTFIGSTIIALVCWVVSYWWKISGHASALAGLTAVAWIYYFLFKGLFMPIYIPVGLIILLGLVCSIRVYLGRHTLSQVYVGSIVGLTLMTISFQILFILF